MGHQNRKDAETEEKQKGNEYFQEHIPLNEFSKINQKIMKPTCLENLSRYFSQYCGATSIHGFQYLGERGRYLIEKIVWLGILITVWYFCGSLIMKSYEKWRTSPVLVTFATTETPIWKIPFPAVTICPDVKYDPGEVQFSDIYTRKMMGENVSKYEELTLRAFFQICDQFNQSELLDDFEHQKFADDSELFEIFFAFANIIGNLSDWGSTWLGKPLKDEYISLTFTEIGICYSFNMLNTEEILKDADEFLTLRLSDETKASKWSLDEGYWEDKINYHTYPKRTFTAGLSGGANFYLYTNNNYIDPFCGEGLEGFKIMLHHPSEFPDPTKHIQLGLNQALNIGIKPKMITVKDDLRDYSPEVKNCYYSDQRQLMYFKNYSQNNCFSECLSNYTLAKCGCIPFYLPKDAESPVCGTGSRECVERCKVHIGIRQVPAKAKHKCHCLPSCTHLEYDIETSQSNWNWRTFFKSIQHAGGNTTVAKIDLEKDHLSWLSVYYKEVQFLTSERHELYGYVDFFANTGGLLGLFIGFSVTSAIEILYFLTLRLTCNFKKFGRKYWSGDEELLEGKKEENSS